MHQQDADHASKKIELFNVFKPVVTGTHTLWRWMITGAVSLTRRRAGVSMVTRPSECAERQPLGPTLLRQRTWRCHPRWCRLISLSPRTHGRREVSVYIPVLSMTLKGLHGTSRRYWGFLRVLSCATDHGGNHGQRVKFFLEGGHDVGRVTADARDDVVSIWWSFRRRSTSRRLCRWVRHYVSPLSTASRLGECQFSLCLSKDFWLQAGNVRDKMRRRWRSERRAKDTASAMVEIA